MDWPERSTWDFIVKAVQTARRYCVEDKVRKPFDDLSYTQAKTMKSAIKGVVDCRTDSFCNVYDLF